MTEEAKKLVAALRNSYDYSERRDAEAADLIESLSAQLEQVTMERDAAVDKLRGKCAECINEYPGITHLKGSICENCVFNGDYYAQTEDNWQWRGVEVEG